MTSFVLSPAAKADLASIWQYTTGRWNIEQADRYLLEINTACKALAKGQRTGRSIDKARSGYKKLSVGSHFVVYRTVDNSIDVVRILHQRMDILSNLEH
jgi:toxin ParE1/3/4